MTWKCVPHKMFLWISLLDTFQMKNPSDATLASLSILKYSKWPPNGGKYCKNQHHTCTGSKKVTSLVVLIVFFWLIRPCPFKNCIMNCLKKKIKLQDGVKDGCSKQESSTPELHLHYVLCFKGSFYVLININTII